MSDLLEAMWKEGGANFCQSEVSQVSDEPRREPCHAARPRRERREPVWLRDYVRTVVVYPTWPLNFVRTFACLS